MSYSSHSSSQVNKPFVCIITLFLTLAWSAACSGGAPRRSETRAGKEYPVPARPDLQVRCGVPKEHGGLERHCRQSYEPAAQCKYFICLYLTLNDFSKASALYNWHLSPVESCLDSHLPPFSLCRLQRTKQRRTSNCCRLALTIAMLETF